MKEKHIKAIIRKLRKSAIMWMPQVPDESYEMGRLASRLIPDWVESGHEGLDDFLHAHGMSPQLASKISLMALAYYEVPSLEVWRKLGYWNVIQASRLNQEACIETLMAFGANPLDVMEGKLRDL